jgi:hypothetical protein
MRQVVFRAPDGAIEEQLSGRVPVNVLDGTLELISTTRLGEPAPLEPGLYAARATLPNGRKYEATFAVTDPDGDDIDVLLARTDDVVETAQQYAPPSIDQQLKSFDAADLGRIAAQVLAPIRKEAPAQCWVRIGYGNPFGKIKWKGASKRYTAGEELEVAGPEPAQVIMQMKPALWQVVAPVLPKIEGHEVDARRVSMVRRQGSAFPHFHFKNPDLEMLLRYLASDSQRPVEGLAGEESVVAKRAFDDPGYKPLAAAAGAYALLRLGRLDDLDWTPQMPEKFPWLPDAYAIHGEWRARRGEHDQAQASFLRIPEVGLPYFSMGLSDAVNRLSQYAAAGFEGGDERAKVLAQLQEISGRTDFARPITTWRV